MQNPIQNWKSIFPVYTLTSGYDYDTESDHEETTNYNFDDGCYNNGPVSQSYSNEQSTTWLGWDYNFWFSNPWSGYNLPNDFILNSATIEIDFELYDLWSDETMDIYYNNMLVATFTTDDFDCNGDYCTGFFTIDVSSYGLSSWEQMIWINSSYYTGTSNVSVTYNLDYTASGALDQYNLPKLVYEWYSEECWYNEHNNDGDYLGYGCGWHGGDYDTELFANGEMLCSDWDGYGVIDCDCSEAEIFSNQVFTNMIGDINISDIHYVRMLYFPEGGWYMDGPYWDYDIFYIGQYLDPCLTWDAPNYSSWQSDWNNITFNGLFPDMTLNEFFDLVGISNDDWEQSSCEEDDQ